MRTICRSRWLVPLFSLAAGAILFGAQAVGGHPGSGAVSFGILAAFAATVVILAILVAFVVSLAQGRDGNPYTWLAAVAGIAYLGAIVALRVRG